jgi:pyrimidine and pyridine-specific 5'-nucleotidase
MGVLIGMQFKCRIVGIFAVANRISDKYFQTHLSLSQEDANELHMRYYKDYGLAIEGLVRHHKVDALEYNEKVDDALPLEDIMSNDPKLRKLLKDLDTSKVKPWLFTNAYINHGRRVVKLLGVEDMFEGITYCDYSAAKFLCKPSPDMFKKAMAEAGVTSPEDCYFVGTLHFVELLCASVDINRRRLRYQCSWCDQDGLDCRPFG